MRDTIQSRLSVLLHLPLWAVGRAGTLEWFHFGGHHAVPDRRIEIKDVGDFALHIDCPWLLLSSPFGGVIATDESSPQDLAEVGEMHLECVEVVVGDRGAFELHFATKHCLKVEPDDEEAQEFWRLFEPHRETPHFVVGAFGIEPRDA